MKKKAEIWKRLMLDTKTWHSWLAELWLKANCSLNEHWSAPRCWCDVCGDAAPFSVLTATQPWQGRSSATDSGRIQLQNIFLMSHSHLWGTLLNVTFSSVQSHISRIPCAQHFHAVSKMLDSYLCLAALLMWDVEPGFWTFAGVGLSLNFNVHVILLFFVSTAIRFEAAKMCF